MSKTALITGVSGQDGSYLAELLLAKGYAVHGLVRPQTMQEVDKLWRIAGIRDRLALHSADVNNVSQIGALVQEVKPAEIYHLASKTEVQFSDNDFSSVTNELQSLQGPLEAIRRHSQATRLFFASSAKIYGIPETSPQNENTLPAPVSFYGLGKAVCMELVRLYRRQGLFAVSGILFNHESPRRDDVFLPKKIARAAARIKLGLDRELKLGNLDAKRDWGFAGDYAEAMWQMLQAEQPADYVIGTGVIHTVRDVLDAAFGAVGLDWPKYVAVDETFKTPAEPQPIVADISKIRRELGWKPHTEFRELISTVVQSELERNQ